ncbi:MAG: hypothetical protein OCD76_22625 [Reichenbachiella sp.]
MRFLKSLTGSQSNDKKTTRNFFIGTPEAEGESTFNSRMKLAEIFGDFLKVFPELETEKFIISGRKGSGKSAIAEFLLFSANNDPNVFCDFVKTRDLQLNKIVQVGKEEGLPIEDQLLYEWIILTKLIKQLTEDQSVQDIKEYKDLNKFLHKNSGLVDINSYEIKEIVENKSMSVNIEYFKRAFKSMFKKELGIKSHKAPFYKILPNLRETVLKLLTDTSSSENEYYLIFDDLDIGFKESDESSIENLTNLLRVSKDYNIDHFGKQGLKAKIIILLRDDIKRIIVKKNADTAKIFSSYEIPLIWYEHEKFKDSNDEVGLKKMINKRIKANFDQLEIDYNEHDPWNSFIKPDFEFKGSSFKYLLDFTLFRPRDLILLFKPLPKNSYTLPLKFEDCRQLIESYVEELVLEIKNELSTIFSSEDIDRIFSTLKNLKRKQPLTKAQIVNNLTENGLDYNIENTLIHLFDYSILGNLEHRGNGIRKVFFKYRESKDEAAVVNFKHHFIYHNAIDCYLDKRG